MILVYGKYVFELRVYMIDNVILTKYNIMMHVGCGIIEVTLKRCENGSDKCSFR